MQRSTLTALSSIGSVAIAVLVLLLAIHSWDAWKYQQTLQSSITRLDMQPLAANTPLTNSAPGGRAAAGRR
ncbi:hypothetical protein [Pantanalinema sp. GBBB05]|uniref:hypothetical protein n=1 Tax=Pantanalinema sp. GBBB05 TaxID=2604139 RepID=UPI001D2CF5E2|nr:hypothetical protein [Pantanalinema sp. GBBB05]